VVLVGWQIEARHLANPVILPTPTEVGKQLILLTVNGALLSHTLASSWRLVIAYFVAIGLGVSTGLAIGLNRHAKAMVDPLIEVVRPIPGIAWIPLALFFFGIGNIVPIFIIIYVAFFPIALNTVAGVLATDKLLVRAALTMGVSRSVIIRRVIVPGSMPYILTGMRISVAGAWMALIAAELIGAPAGLGFAIQWYGSLFETPSMLAVIIAVSLLGFCSDIALRFLQRRLTPWSIGLTVAS